MNIPTDLYYTDQHEWLRVEGAAGTIGISDYAQKALGDITFVELPKAGKAAAAGQEVAAIESCKAAAGVYSPVTGKVIEVNSALNDEPGAINKDPYGAGWIFKIALENIAEIDALMNADKYAEFCGKEPL
jgi:glycine cleavage system H protein